MFWERYYKRFPVRVKIIAYNCIIILCHLVEVAIFAVSDFFSLFSIAVFNIPITHIIIVLLFLLQSYNLFSYLQIFFNFFYIFFHCLKSDIYMRVCPCCWCSSLFRWSCSVGACSPLLCCPAIIRTRIHAHTRAYARTRTGIFRP